MVAVDTNVLAYAEGVNDSAMQQAAQDLLQRLPASASRVPVQVLGELFNVLVRKGGWSREQAKAAVLVWRNAYPVIETSIAAFDAATDLATDYRLSIWDALILAAASGAGCRLLLSEDLQHGFSWGGVTVVNPFAGVRHELLTSILES